MIPKLQLPEYKGVQIELGSQSEPPQSHHRNFLATTIQFHPGANGLTTFGIELPATIAGQPKHIAVHNHHVKVGVTNILNVFVGERIHLFHQAQSIAHQQANLLPHHGRKNGGQNVKLEAGKTEGIHMVQVAGQHATSCGVHVNQEKIGIHSHTFNQSQIKCHMKTGSFQGANGAQFNGEAKHDALPNQQLNQSIMLCTLSSAESIFSQADHKSRIIDLSKLNISSESGTQSLSESLLIISNCSFA